MVERSARACTPTCRSTWPTLGDSDGAELVRSLRADGYCGLVVGWSASSLRDDQERMLGAGADAYLVKPVPPPVLKETLRELLQARA